MRNGALQPKTITLSNAKDFSGRSHFDPIAKPKRTRHVRD